MFQKIIQDYQKFHQSKLEQELSSFSELKNYDELIRRVACCKDPAGKKYSHQHRISRNACEESFEILKALSFDEISDFDSLYNYLKTNLLQVDGIGPLYIYDAALRIGAFYKLDPEKIYLHAGTLEGARNLEWNTSKGYFTLQELPTDLQRIPPKSIEAILCIYKDCFENGEIKLNASKCRFAVEGSGVPLHNNRC